MNIYKEAKAIVDEAVKDCRVYRCDVEESIWQSCGGHEVSIYHQKAIQFCADHDTSDGEDFLEDIGGIAQPGDTFGMIARRLAFATLYCACMDRLSEMESE